MEKIYAAIEEFRSLSDNGVYLSYIRNILNRNDLTGFKHHPDYNLILEHASDEQGFGYLEAILKQTPEFIEIIDRFKLNDKVGNLERVINGRPTFRDYGPIKGISPSTLRYVKFASDLKYYFGELGENIAEIGTGYGGQCLILDQIFKWKRYFLFDLDLPLQLTSRYLENFLLNSSYTCTTLNQYWEKEIDFVLSTVAFSELPSKLQIRYLEKVISKSKKGYLLMNSGFEGSFFSGDFLKLETIQKYIPNSEIIPESPDPLRVKNKVIIWGHKK